MTVMLPEAGGGGVRLSAEVVEPDWTVTTVVVVGRVVEIICCCC